MSDTKERKVTLFSKKKNDEKTFTLRSFVYGDERSVIECVREEYGDTYYRREYYDEDLLRKEVESGKLLLYLACFNDEVCGFQSLIRYAPEESRIEAASQIFKKAYRGYGLPFELVKYTYEIARDYHPSCIYASTVVFHSITQNMCELVGMVPVAFNLGSHLTSAMHNSFWLGDSEKYAQAILILPVDKKNAGRVYIHEDIAGKAAKIYADLGVDADIATSGDDEKNAAVSGKESCFDVSVNEREQSISIKVHSIGDDLLCKIREIKDSHSGKYWTIQLILPVDRPEALKAYEALDKEGFYFVGLRPLCSDTEQIFLQYTGDVYFDFADFKLTPKFEQLLQMIRNAEDGKD
ncbi:MAG: hypothetical protein K6F86_07305 [Lachnospiraceae bacterium]|nr:hypothetical protein [Lachnospiraceae bacterium]